MGNDTKALRVLQVTSSLLKGESKQVVIELRKFLVNKGHGVALVLATPVDIVEISHLSKLHLPK